MRVAIYARASTKDKGQEPENQLHQLREFAEKHGTITHSSGFTTDMPPRWGYRSVVRNLG